jgi:hypothetical protein
MEHFLQGNGPLKHLLNAKPLFAFNEVNDCAPKIKIGKFLTVLESLKPKFLD